MPDQITEKVKNVRSAALISLGNEMSSRYRRTRLGTLSTVIPEEYRQIEGEDYLCGFTPEYICAAIGRPGKPGDNGEITHSPVTGRIDRMLNDEVVLLVPD